MSNFVDDLTDLPGPKIQMEPVPEDEADYALSSDDYNEVRQACYDLRGAVLDADLDDNAVTDAKLRDSAATSVIGRGANTSGDPADIAASADGDVLRRSGTTLGFGAIPQASVTSLVGDLAGKAAASHSHAESDVTGLTDDLAGKQPLDAGLSSLAGLGATTGLIEKTATDTYTERLIGVGASTSIPTRADADTRYAASSHTHTDVTTRSLLVLNYAMTGIDSSVVFDGTTIILGVTPTGSNLYTFPTGASARDYQCINITVNSGITVKLGNSRLFWTGTFENNGTVSCAGATAAGQAGAAGAAVGTLGSAQSNGGAGGTNAVGSIGSNITGILPAPYSSTNATSNAGAIATPGSNGQVRFKGGGGGGGATTNAGAAAGTITVAGLQTGQPTMLDLIWGIGNSRLGVNWNGGSGGGGGGGGAAGNGGGGGGGGGYMALAGDTITGTGTFTVNGGDGGPATGTGGGGGGGGGGLGVCLYATRAGSLTFTAAGGTHGAAGTGQIGGDGANGYFFLFNLSGDGT